MNPKLTGSFITALRKEHGLTQKQLAERLNISDKAVSRWETGKGYPDIESLMALSDLFSVSVNEILCGKRINTPSLAQIAEKDIASAYIQTTEKKQKISKLTFALAVLLSLIVITIGGFFLTSGFQALYKQIMGSPNCVIAEDYSYMTLFGERYVPLVLNGVDCTPSEALIPEAQLEGETFFGKLLFGDMIYSIRNCKNNDIVFLQSDYDLLESEYYCKESKLEELQAKAKEEMHNILTAEIRTEDGFIWDLTLSQTLSEMIINKQYSVSLDVNCDWSRGDGDEFINVHSTQQEGPFIRHEGSIIRKGGEYYWFDYDDIPPTQDNADYSGIMAYEIDDRYDAELDQLFSYVHQ